MMSREEVHIRQHRDRLLALAESTAAAAANKPNNTKRRSLHKSPLRFTSSTKSRDTPKLSIQDFVRADPGYTPNIEHLVFPDRRKASPVKSASTDGGKTRSRLAEMFALSRHLQQRSADRETKQQTNNQRKQIVNRSVDSSMECARMVGGSVSGRSEPPRRWATADEPVHAVTKPANTTSRLSPSNDTVVDRERDIMSARGSNVSILHLRSTSEPWETSPTSVYAPSVSGSSTRSYTAIVHSTSTTGSTVPVLTKHQSLGANTNSYQQQQQQQQQRGLKKDDSFISSSQISSGELFTCSRELSPVRWCDREVDGVYLGRSGWVQVQQRSLDENRRNNYASSHVTLTPAHTTPCTATSTSSSLPQTRRPNMKLADYHCNSEPTGLKRTEHSRPAYLPLRKREVDFQSTTPSPPPPPAPINTILPPESFSPPPITPIISPPPAFQDRITKPIPKPRMTFGRPPILPRSNAIVDSDIISPPISPPAQQKLHLPPPPINWSTMPEPRPTAGTPGTITGSARRIRLTPSPVKSLPGPGSTAGPYSRIPQAKSLEEAGTGPNRRTQFLQRYKDSSSSSSSSLGFRSLDSCVSRPAMPRLSEHTDSLDMYEDADEEDNNSSSLNLSNLSNVSSVLLNSSPDSVLERIGSREKTSPSGRSRFVHHRSQRRSPGSSDANKQLTCSSPSSSSSSGGEHTGTRDGGFPARSPLGSAAPFRRSAPSRQHTAMTRGPIAMQDDNRVRRSRSLQLPEKRSPSSMAAYREQQQQQQQQHNILSNTKLSPQQAPEVHRLAIKVSNSMDRTDRIDRNRRPHQIMSQPQSLKDSLDEEMLREAEVVTEFLYGSRSRAAAKALLLHRYHERRDEPPQQIKDPTKLATNNGFNIYYVGSGNKQQRQKVLQRGATTPNLTPQHQTYTTSPTNDMKNPCNSTTCDFWPHCAQRESTYSSAGLMKASQSYPTHQRPLEQTTHRSITPERANEPHRKQRTSAGLNGTNSRLSPDNRYTHRREKPDRERRPSPMNRSPMNRSPMSRSPSGGAGNSSCSSSSSDVWLTTSERTITRSPRDASTPLDEAPPLPITITPNSLSVTPVVTCEREMILTRPGSAPADVDEKLVAAAKSAELADQQRSMSLPKSFLSGNGATRSGGQFPCKRQGTDSLRVSPSPHHRPPTPEVAHTAPVTPSHEPSVDRKRSPGFTKSAQRNKASSTPHLLDQPDWETNRKWLEKNTGSVDTSIQKDNMGSATVLSSHPRLQATDSGQGHKNMSESVLQKFRKTFSLRFQKKGSKESCSSDYGDGFIDPSEEDSPLHVPVPPPDPIITSKETDSTEQKYRFGPLVWRSSKERKKNNKATRSLKCNSGDSGIQIEMVSGFSGGGGTGGDSSESHDTDQLGDGDGDDTDSPQPVRRRSRTLGGEKGSRPHSDHLINQILIEKFKADLQSRSHRHQHVRRTHSDLGGQRLLQWDTRNPYYRMMSTPSPVKGRPNRVSPRRNPPEAPGGVQLRGPRRNGRPQLRRSLSQPVDIDKLSPLMRTKTAGLRLAGTTNVLSEDEHDGRIGTSDDEMMSDSESSVASLSERKKSLEPAMDEDMVILAEAVFDHVAIEAEELAFRAGDVIEVLETVNRDWWWGSTDRRKGWFPAAFVRLRVSQEDTVEDCLAAMASGKTANKQLRRRTSISLLSNEQVRTSVVRELVHTERDFVKVLTDVVEGYLTECRRRKDMFTPEQIQTIFINLEDMLKFQSAFLKDLEACIDWDAPHKSCVGNCFLTHRAGFRMYSDYCNHHPMATATLQELYQFNSYSKFFEACRLMRGLIEIPLDGYLLTPVQRICKYPLQLAELLKYTKTDHADYEKIKEALEAMRDVAVLINERKRRMESLEKLSAWQQRVEGWEGEDLIDASTQLIYQGEVIRVTSGMWTNNITLFLFDHQIVYCKKDILKRNTYVYKGRICTDTSEIIDIPDGKDPQLGVSVRHGLKVYSCIRDKWLLFCCRSNNEKQKWLNAFAQERKLVAQDRDEGLEFPLAARKLAKIAARCQRRPPSKLRSGKNYKRDSAYMGSTLQINSHNSNSLGRKMGTWFTFGSNKKTRHHDQTS